MIQIKHRAKSLDDKKWVIGYYAMWQNEHVIFPLTPIGRMRKIDPNTVGVFSGNSFNGKEECTGDIILMKWQEAARGRYFQSDDAWCNYEERVIVFYEGGAFRYKSIQTGKCVNIRKNSECIIIGNIYDNSELIKSPTN